MELSSESLFGMTRRDRVVTAAEAVALIRDGAPARFRLWIPPGVQLPGPVEPCMSEEV
jgi:hypothetical protein